MTTKTQFEPRSIDVYMQRAIRPISKRFYYSNYVNELPIKNSDRILEFGSGIGAMAELLARKVDQGELTCVDISDRYLAAAKRHLKDYPNTAFFHGRIGTLELKDNSYDAVNIHFVLHDVLIENRQKIVSDLFSLLRPGGKVYLREPIRSAHGMPSSEIRNLFKLAGFYPLFEEEGRVRILGDVFTACYTKIFNIQFFFA